MFAPYKTEKPEAPVKADPFSLDALIAWLRTKPDNEGYCYMSTGECLAAQYHRFVGSEYDIGIIKDADLSQIDCVFNYNFRQQMEWIAQLHPRTFAGALSRALAIKARTP
jgi:hypothetical protein